MRAVWPCSLPGAYSGVKHFVVGLEEAHALAVGERLDAHAVALLRGAGFQIATFEAAIGFLVDDAARLVLLRVGLGASSRR
jgi:hypothetical protein